MYTVDRIKEICKNKGIALYRLEKECGFGNGYIGQLKKGSVPNDRLMIIANYLNVSPEYLTTGQETKKTSTDGTDWYFSDDTARLAQEIHEKPHLRSLFDAERDLSPESARALEDFIIAQKRKEQGDGYAE